MASNVGSAATFTGNLQNMIIGVSSHLAYADFAGKFARAVPAVLIPKSFIMNLPDHGRAWLIVAISSTFAGNLALIGSVANIIVAENAKKKGMTISFLAYWRIGVPLTLASLGVGT
jgi:Na+/H+ antiporter NhaD/arsenite permease-like protein